ncbi:MAG: transposase [Clostridiales bacterium]|nr:transposase [Candidatus Crickella equi]
MECINRIAKDLKRNARGFRNFEHLRNRFLFAERHNAQMLAIPLSKEKYAPRTGKKRGPYKKKNCP